MQLKPAAGVEPAPAAGHRMAAAEAAMAIPAALAGRPIVLTMAVMLRPPALWVMAAQDPPADLNVIIPEPIVAVVTRQWVQAKWPLRQYQSMQYLRHRWP